MIYGYARVSTLGQALYGTSLTSQEDILKEKGAKLIYSDVYTGTTKDRPELEKLFKVIKSGDTIIVTKLDRLGRSAIDILEMIRELNRIGVKVEILNMGVFDNTPTGKLMLTMMSGFAEFERDMIRSRLDEGKAIKRASGGKCEGRNSKPYDKDLYLKLTKMVEDGKISVNKACLTLGMNKEKWYRLKKESL